MTRFESWAAKFRHLRNQLPVLEQKVTAQSISKYECTHWLMVNTENEKLLCVDWFLGSMLIPAIRFGCLLLGLRFILEVRPRAANITGCLCLGLVAPGCEFIATLKLVACAWAASITGCLCLGCEYNWLPLPGPRV